MIKILLLDFKLLDQNFNIFISLNSLTLLKLTNKKIGQIK